MKKRVLAALLCAAMVATLFTGCNQTGNEPTENTGSGLSAEPVVYYGFESTDEGWSVVVEDTSKASNKAYDAALATGGVNRTIVAGDKALADLTHAGVKGQCAYLDRNYALDLEFDATNTDAWSVSFWIWGLGMTDYMPTLQFGTDLGFADGQGNVSWLNVTKVGAAWNIPDTFPILWSRNEAYNSWPWMSAYDDTLHAYKEWTHVTIVATGDIYTGPTGIESAGAQLYLDGQLVYDSYDNFNNSTYFEVAADDGNATMAPGLMKPEEGSTFEAYFGINYWDTMFKGCVDEMYVFDKAITAEDVAALYAMGDGEADPQIDTSGEPKENAKPAPNPDAVRVGFNDYTQGWWTTFSDIYEVKEGETKTITYKNYHTGLNYQSYYNSLLILQSTPEGHNAETAGYGEYAVVRLDNHGWGVGFDGIATKTADWKTKEDGQIDVDAFNVATHGSTIVAKITNHGTTADIVLEITAADGTVYHQSYTGIAVTGPVYTCLSVERACIDILSVE